MKIRATGTITYLKVMRNIRDSTFDKTLSPIERIFFMWEVVFFLRIWCFTVLLSGEAVQSSTWIKSTTSI